MASSSSQVAQKFMNTYRLDPKKRFNRRSVQVILRDIITKYCLEDKYDLANCSSKVLTMAGEIMQLVKKLEFDRYRIIVSVQIGGNNQQELGSGMQFLWDNSRDAYAAFSFCGGTMFATAVCYGIYKD